VACSEKSLAKSLTHWSEILAIWSFVVVESCIVVPSVGSKYVEILGCVEMGVADFCLVVFFAHHCVWYRFVMMNIYAVIGWM